jgi:predicted DCC family thiol-disulfide oxidoreductase YuxK
MTGRLSQPPASDNRYLRWAAIAFAIGWGVHLLDHFRRGMSASPHAIMVGGMIQGVFVVVAIAMAITGRRRAPEAAITVGFGSAVLFTYAHLLPSFLPAYQDSFVSGPRINVTWFSWISAVAEIGTGIVFAIAGFRARRPAGVSSVVQLRPQQGVSEMNAAAGTLFFDGACGMCTRSKDLLLKFDRTGNIRTEPLQSPGVAERLGVAPTSLLDAVRWLDSSGTVYSGAEAANAALSTAIGSRIPLVVYRIPGFRFIEDVVYRWVVAHRYRFPGTTPYCESHPTAC